MFHHVNINDNFHYDFIKFCSISSHQNSNKQMTSAIVAFLKIFNDSIQGPLITDGRNSCK